MKLLTYIIMLIICSIVVNALGMGIITDDLDYGTVYKNNNYTKQLKFFPIDNRFVPYTDIIPNYTASVHITSNDSILKFQEYLFVPVNQYSTTNINLFVYKNTIFGIHVVNVCVVNEGEGSAIGGIGLNGGVCVNMRFNVSKKNK